MFCFLHANAACASRSCGWQVVVVYIVLLYPFREPILLGKQTALVSATSFLTHDYEPHVFFWEPLDLIRRTALTGWVRQLRASTLGRSPDALCALQRGVTPSLLSYNACLIQTWQVLLVHEDNSFVRLLVRPAASACCSTISTINRSDSNRSLAQQQSQQ